jgi:hypothetical protein
VFSHLTNYSLNKLNNDHTKFKGGEEEWEQNINKLLLSRKEREHTNDSNENPHGFSALERE